MQEDGPSGADSIAAGPSRRTSTDEAPCASFCRQWNDAVQAALQDEALLADLRNLCEKGAHQYSPKNKSPGDLFP